MFLMNFLEHIFWLKVRQTKLANKLTNSFWKQFFPKHQFGKHRFRKQSILEKNRFWSDSHTKPIWYLNSSLPKHASKSLDSIQCQPCLCELVPGCASRFQWYLQDRRKSRHCWILMKESMDSISYILHWLCGFHGNETQSLQVLIGSLNTALL